MNAGLAAEQIYRKLKIRKRIYEWAFALGIPITVSMALLNQSALFLIALAITATSWFSTRRQPSDKRIERWHIGAETEIKTSELLSAVRAEGFSVIEDVRLPGMIGNIDHLIIGPTGIWVLNSKYKNPRWPITRRGSSWYYGSLDMGPMIAADIRLAGVVARYFAREVHATNANVRPAWVLHGVSVPNGAITVSDVNVVSPVNLSSLILHGELELSWDRVAWLTAAMTSQLSAAAA